jgi:hypothetical protein
MSTDFDSKGFSAVSSFFGDQGITEETAQDLKPTTTQKKRNRLGLGATAKQDEGTLDDLESEETKKKILSIGKKRKHDDDSDVEEDHEDISDEEEEGGRTSIKNKSKPVPSDLTEVADLAKTKKPKKKKKKGKKERLAEKENEQSLPKEGIESEEPTQTPAENETNKDEKASAVERSNAEKRKKRRKVRSKQKNIKKDSRPSHEKPEHLRVGFKSYAGRPMTGETRSFLTLPESRTVSRAKSKHQRFDQATEIADEGGLAIDDLLGEPIDNTVDNTTTIESSTANEDIPDSGEVVNQEIATEDVKVSKQKIQKKAKKKRTKFKNLK